ncbi:MAG: hypothetical protein ACLPHI_09270 [Terriglobales bacterium]
MPENPLASSTLKLRTIATWYGIRVLAWDGNVLYGCRGYEIVRLNAHPEIDRTAEWEVVARFRPTWWRGLTARTNLGYRLVRDGFHALTILHSQTSGERDDVMMVGAVPGALVTWSRDSDQFRVTHRVRRGTRPLHVTAVPSGKIYWGEYFDNRERAEVHIYGSGDRGCTWQIAYTFPRGSIRHVHNIVYDRSGDCLWIITGDEGAECKILRADCNLGSVEVVLSGSQQTRAAAAIPTEHGLYFSTDTPSEKNNVYRLDRSGSIERVGQLSSSSIYGCGVGRAMFFSTMVEPSAENKSREVQIAGSRGGADWQVVARWKKDRWPMRYFQYGNAFLPDGENSTRCLAATTVAVETDDLATTIWEVESP